jgi:3-dehydroquinate synthase
MGIIKIKQTQRTYVDFEFDWGKFEKIAKEYTCVIVLVDSSIDPIHHLYVPIKYPKIKIDSSESLKNLQTVEEIIQKMVDFEVDKSTLCVVIGGGNVLDIGGFVCSIYKRGIDFAYLPTSILAAVDTAIGGKNGINHEVAKNLIGTINQANFIFYDVQLFKTLTKKLFLNGLAEVVKYGFTLDKELFNYLEKFSLEDIMNDEFILFNIVKRCHVLKSKLISLDPSDKNDRKKLNFGHTLGHAFEKHSAISHGFAISQGMFFGIMYSTKMGKLDPKIATRMISILKKFELIDQFDYSIDDIWSFILHDKKRKGKTFDLTFITSIGESEVISVEINDFKHTLNILFHEHCTHSSH